MEKESRIGHNHAPKGVAWRAIKCDKTLIRVHKSYWRQKELGDCHQPKLWQGELLDS